VTNARIITVFAAKGVCGKTMLTTLATVLIAGPPSQDSRSRFTQHLGGTSSRSAHGAFNL
jgi:hypothetical protein